MGIMAICYKCAGYDPKTRRTMSSDIRGQTTVATSPIKSVVEVPELSLVANKRVKRYSEVGPKACLIFRADSLVVRMQPR
jgi:hypothetical protein